MSVKDFNVENTAQELYTEFQQALVDGNPNKASQIVATVINGGFEKEGKQMAEELEAFYHEVCQTCFGKKTVDMIQFDTITTKQCPDCN